MCEHDKEVELLRAYRASRDSAVREAEALNDEAILFEIAAAERKERARMLYRQVNEDVPVPEDQGL